MYEKGFASDWVGVWRTLKAQIRSAFFAVRLCYKTQLWAVSNLQLTKPINYTCRILPPLLDFLNYIKKTKLWEGKLMCHPWKKCILILIMLYNNKKRACSILCTISTALLLPEWEVINRYIVLKGSNKTKSWFCYLEAHYVFESNGQSRKIYGWLKEKNVLQH